MVVDDSPGTAATSQGRKRGTTGGGPGRRLGGGGGSGAGAADVAGAMEQGFGPRRAGGGGAAGSAGGSGPGGQQEIGGGGGFWQSDNNGMGIGGRSTSTPAAREPGQRLVVVAVAVAVGREGSRRSVVAAVAEMTAVQRKRWAGTGVAGAARAKRPVGPMGERRRPRIVTRCQEHSGGIGISITGDKRSRGPEKQCLGPPEKRQKNAYLNQEPKFEPTDNSAPFG
jgi:hypothetical protein